MSEPLIENNESNQEITIQSQNNGNKENNNEANYENGNETNSSEEKKGVVPMYKNNPEEINNLLPNPSNEYSLDKLFIYFFFNSLIYCIINVFTNDISCSDSILGWSSAILFILGIVLFISIQKNEQNTSAGCAFCLFLMFFIFKISFSFYLNYLEKYINIKNNPFDYDDDFYRKKYLHIPHLLFSNISTGVFYICLIIYIKIKVDISLLIIFIFGIIISIVTFVVLFPIYNVTLAGIVVGIIFLEILSLIISISIAKNNNLLEEDETLNNSVNIDYYKFFLIMCIFFLTALLILFAIGCVCSILAACCGQEESKAKYYDKKGNVYDQRHKKMGIHLSKKPKYVDEDGKFYDKHHKEIKPDSDCQIF